jgi:hypothetical protein
MKIKTDIADAGYAIAQQTAKEHGLDIVDRLKSSMHYC